MFTKNRDHIISLYISVSNDRIRRLDIGSSEISSEKLSYLFEVTDSVWKPELKLFLDQLVNLTHLVFRCALV